MRKLKCIAVAALIFSFGLAHAQEPAEPLPLNELPLGDFALDMSQSQIGFRIVNFGISSLSGEFTAAEGELTLVDPDAATNSIGVRTEANSAEMSNQRFRRIMLGPAFFDAENHPVLTFEATNVAPTGGTIEGLMTMRGITAPVTLNAALNGITFDEATGAATLHYIAETTIDRTDWGMTGYRWIAGTDVELNFDARFVYDGISEPGEALPRQRPIGRKALRHLKLSQFRPDTK